MAQATRHTFTLSGGPYNGRMIYSPGVLRRMEIEDEEDPQRIHIYAWTTSPVQVREEDGRHIEYRSLQYSGIVTEHPVQGWPGDRGMR